MNNFSECQSKFAERARYIVPKMHSNSADNSEHSKFTYYL